MNKKRRGLDGTVTAILIFLVLQGLALPAQLRHCRESLGTLHGKASQSNKVPTIRLTVKHNGEDVAPPTQLIFSIHGHSARLPVTSGFFEIPPEISKAGNAEKVRFQTEVDGDRILTKVGTQHFGDGGSWTLILEDSDFGPRFSRVVSKGTPALSGCALVFQPKTGDGIETFDAHCRTPIKK